MKLSQKTKKGGNLVSVAIYSRPLPRDTKAQRAEKHRVTCEAQRKINNKTRYGNLAFLLSANFNQFKDFFITLSYEEEFVPTTRKAAIKNEQGFIRRLRDMRKKRGVDMKYIVVTEGKHGEKKFHHHLVINATDFSQDLKDIRRAWGFGHVEIETLFNSNHCDSSWMAIAKYLSKERPVDGPDVTPVGARIYSCSRNLIHPKAVYEIVEEKEQAQIPKDAEIIEQGESQTFVDGMPISIRYFTYQLKPRPAHYMRR